jgi:hypothetical protein
MEKEELKNTKKVYEDEWLQFYELDQEDRKTRRIIVWSKCSDCYLGKIKWYPQWRHYCHVIEMEHIGLMTEELVFSDRCQEAILNFTRKLNKEKNWRLKHLKS